jgi:aldehyde:ferredoxin oxidoreductase
MDYHPSMHAWHGKALYIDLSARKTWTEQLPEQLLASRIGGRGLGVEMMRDSFTLDPYDSRMPLIFAVGPLCGTPAPASSRMSVISRSPLTGTITDSSVGGTFPIKLKAAGYDCLVITGKASSPVRITIQNETVRIREADALWGKGCLETTTHLESRGITACIGPAGERLVRFANIMIGGADAAGRGGLGAVMGSKNLKAVVVRGTGGIEVADRKGLMRRAAVYGSKEKSKFKRNFELGTAGGVTATEAFGDMPIRNFLGGRWADQAERVSGQTMFTRYGKHERSCLSCPSNCTLIVDIPGTALGHAPEYETIGAFGSMCECDRIEVIAQCNDLCNDYGLDTISAGNTIAFVMEAFEKGILTEAALDGIRPTWGNAEAMVALLHKMGKREGIGDLLADGTRPAAERLGKDLSDMLVEVKGVEVPMHDPRAFWSNALNYAVANRGACHMEGVTFTVESGLPFPDLGYTAPMDRFVADGKAELNVKMHDLMALYDGLGICKFYIVVSYGPTVLSEWLNLCTGWTMTPEDLMRTGERIFTAKRAINVERGLTRKDDYLPKRLLTVPQRDDIGPVSPHGMERMLDEYYRLRGWSADGAPSAARMQALGLA